MTDAEWEEAKQRGSRPNAFVNALHESFEQLGSDEQEAWFEEIRNANNSKQNGNSRIKN
jgi:hypothetical protein